MKEGIRLPRAGLIAGPLLFTLVLLFPAPEGMSEGALRVAALTLWMATWWMTVPVPLEATALLPLVVLPLTGVTSFDRAAGPYANSVIFLFLGGFFLAAAMERWGLHKRVAYNILAAVGTDSNRVVFAFMAATCFISMWISNTATAVMMMPMAVAVITLTKESGEAGARGGFATAMVLGIAYAANIGGMATLIGTPPNAIFAGAVRQMVGREFGFGEWMKVGMPVVLVLLPICWLILTRLFPSRGKITGLAERVGDERRTLGPLRGAERFTLLVFLLAVMLWILREPKDLGAFTIPGVATWLPAVSDSLIAIAAALALFLIPVSWGRWQFALDWPTARQAPWGMLLLFGGGLSLADAFQTTGLSSSIGGLLSGLAGQPEVLVIGVVCLVFIGLSELASNAAVAAMAMPLLFGIATALGQPPERLMQAAALAASVSFLLPVSTPPNTVAFATGEVTVGQMMKAGVGMDVVSAVVLTAAMMLLG